MADIIQAAKWLEEGNRIARKIWKDDGDGYHIYRNKYGVIFESSADKEYPFRKLEELMWDDWEIYEEPFEITETGMYKTKEGARAFISCIERGFVVGIIDRATNTSSWYNDGTIICGACESFNIVSKWED